MQQERLRALGQMASGIAHDINNAISPMSLYTEAVLEHETGLSERGRKQLEIVQRAVDDVAQTVARMGEFYRSREPEVSLEPVDLNLLLEHVADLTRVRWSDMAQQRGAVIEMRLQQDAALPRIAAVQSQIRDALVNLVFNAVDAMPSGGTLTIRTRTAIRAQGNWAVLEIVDNDVGMDEETRRRCLEPFFSTKGTRGTGLGLPMVYGVVQRHGAQIEIEAARQVFRQLGAAPDLERLDALSGKAAGKKTAGLTERELEVLRLVAAGKSNRAIAAELSLSEHTVRRHLQNIFAKVRVSSRAAATAFAYENSLL